MRPTAELIALDYKLHGSMVALVIIRRPRYMMSQSLIHRHSIQSSLVLMVRTHGKYYNIYHLTLLSNIYGHRLKKTRHPVRSAKVKFQIDLSVVGWVTTSESRLLYIFDYLFALVSCGVGKSAV